MSVPSPVYRNLYNANGVATVYAYSFKILSAEHIRVWTAGLDGVAAEMLTGFTVDSVGDENGGSVTFATAPANLRRVLIERDIPMIQETSYRTFQPVPPKVNETSHDAEVMMVQQAYGEALRALRLRKTDAEGSGVYDAGGNWIGGLADPLKTDQAATRGWVLSVLASLGVGGAGEIPQYKESQKPNPLLESSARFIRVIADAEDEAETLQYLLTKADGTKDWAIVATAPF